MKTMKKDLVLEESIREELDRMVEIRDEIYKTVTLYSNSIDTYLEKAENEKENGTREMYNYFIREALRIQDSLQRFMKMKGLK